MDASLIHKTTESQLLMEKEQRELLAFPDPEKTKQFLDLNTIRKKVGNTYEKYPLKTDITELSQYGIGLQLFFIFIKKMILCFAVMSLIGLIPLIVNCLWESFDENTRTTKFDSTTLGNQPKYTIFMNHTYNYYEYVEAPEKIRKSIRKDNQDGMQKFESESVDRLYLVMFPDFVSTLFFIIFVGYMRHIQRRQIKLDKQTLRVSDFSLEVSGFPQSIVDENVIKNHFKQFGEVVECKLARNYYGTLLDNKNISDLIKSLMREKKRLERDSKRSKKSFEKLLEKRKKLMGTKKKCLEKHNLTNLKHDDYPSLKAFVIFNDSNVRNKVLKEYIKDWAWTAKRFFCPFTWKIDSVMPPERQLLGKYPIKVKEPHEPSNILWENLDATNWQLFYRKLISSIAVTAFMILTFLCIIAANLFQSSSSDGDCNDYTQLLKTGVVNQNNVERGTLQYECYCVSTKISFVELSTDPSSFCHDYGLKKTRYYLLTILGGFVIVEVNFWCKVVLRLFGKYERYASITEETISSTMKIFVVTFINTSILPLILNGRIVVGSLDFNLSKIILQDILNIFTLDERKYPIDFTKKWYSDVGSKLITTWWITVFSPHLVFLLTTPLYNYLRKRNRSKAVIQKDMNENSFGPPYDLTAKYALALNVIFVTLFYSSGIPLMLLLGTASLFLQFWVEKYLLLRYNRKPPVYDVSLNYVVISLLPVAIILHLLIGIWMYGCPEVFPITKDGETTMNLSFLEPELPMKNTGGMGPIVNNTVITIKNVLRAEIKYRDLGEFANRVRNVWLLFIQLLGLILFYTADVSIYRWSKAIWLYFRPSKVVEAQPTVNLELKHDESQDNKKKNSFKDEFERLLHVDIPSYDIRMNSRYIELVATIDGIGNTTKDLQNFEFLKEDHINEEQLPAGTEIRRSEDINPEMVEIKKSETKRIEFEEKVDSINEPKNHYNTPFKIEMSEGTFFPKKE